MAFSKVLIEFNVMPEIDSYLFLVEETYGINILETFKDRRFGPNQVRLPRETNIPGQYSGNVAQNYFQAVNLDSNAAGLFTIVWGADTFINGLGSVTITANYPNAVFSIDLNSSPAEITITNETQTPVYEISNFSFSSSESNKCQYVMVNLQTTELTKRIVEPIVIDDIDSDNFSFIFLRGQHVRIVTENELGQTATRTIDTPGFLVLDNSNFNLQINYSPNGATVVCNVQSPDSLSLQFSLDELTWQNNNVFNGLTEGDYTLYIRDQFGCSTSKDFYISDSGINSPFFYISKSNSIRYAQRITWGDSANYKNDENSLSCEADVLSPHTEIQRFQSADIIPTQFKSNYSTHKATVLKPDGTEVDIPIQKKTTNIGNKEKRDAIKYNFGNGKTGIYFLSGNIYDYNTNIITGPYVLNGALPYWGQIGNYIFISGAWFLIEEIFFDENKNAEVIVINSSFIGVDTPIVVGSVFNFMNYEVYEYNIDMLQFLNQCVRVRLECEDSHFVKLTYLSELIDVKVKHLFCVELRYRNTTNTDVFYNTGIEFKLRQRISKKAAIPDQDSEINKTDTNAILLQSELYEVDEFTFEPVTTEMMRKILIALSHESLYINEVGYVKNDNIDVEGPLDESNLYVVKAKMIKSGYVYSSQSNGSENQIFNGESLEIPGLLDFGGGFVRY